MVTSKGNELLTTEAVVLFTERMVVFCCGGVVTAAPVNGRNAIRQVASTRTVFRTRLFTYVAFPQSDVLVVFTVFEYKEVTGLAVDLVKCVVGDPDLFFVTDFVEPECFVPISIFVHRLSST